MINNYEFIVPRFSVPLSKSDRSCQLTLEIAGNIFQRSVLGSKEKIKTDSTVDIRNYAKYILKEGTVVEKRELLANLKSRVVYKDKKVSLK